MPRDILVQLIEYMKNKKHALDGVPEYGQQVPAYGLDMYNHGRYDGK
jgi:hypothetical protein